LRASIRTDLWPAGATKTQRSIRTIDVAADTLAKLDLTGESVFTHSGRGLAGSTQRSGASAELPPTSGRPLDQGQGQGPEEAAQTP
jgi:hypothetical protein